MYNTAGIIVTNACQWLIIMVLPKISNYSEVGLFAAAMSICSMLNILATFSLTQYQISDQYRRFSENDYLVVRLVTISISFAFLIPTILVMGYSTEQILVVVLYLGYRNLIHIAYFYTATLQFVNRLDYVGLCTIVEGVVSFVLFITIYIFTGDIVLSTFAMVFSSVLFLVLIMKGYRKYVGRTPIIPLKSDRIRELMLIGIPLMFAALAPMIITALPKLILQYHWGDDILGIFSTLSSPTMVVPIMVTSAFVPFIVMFSDYVQAEDLASLRRQYIKLIAAILLLGIILLAISLIAAGTVFGLIYGDELSDHILNFHILLLSMTFFSIGACGNTVLITKNQGKLSAYATFVVLLVSIVIFFAIIPSQGILGASYSLLAATIIFAAISSFCVYAVPLTEYQDM